MPQIEVTEKRRFHPLLYPFSETQTFMIKLSDIGLVAGFFSVQLVCLKVTIAVSKTLSLLDLMFIFMFCAFSEPACERIVDSTFPLLLEQLKQDIEASVNEILPLSFVLD